MEQLLKVWPEVGRRLQCSRSVAYQLIAQGTIPCVRMGRSVRVPESALEAWIRSETKPATEPVPPGRATGRERGGASR